MSHLDDVKVEGRRRVTRSQLRSIRTVRLPLSLMGPEVHGKHLENTVPGLIVRSTFTPRRYVNLTITLGRTSY